MTKPLQVGDQASLKKAFTEEDVLQFAQLSTDRNPVHLNREYAEASMFGQPIVNNMLVSSLFSALLEQHLPGEGTIHLSQEVQFKGPVYLNEEVTATVEVTAIEESKPIITLAIRCYNSLGREVITGNAEALTTHI